MDNKLYVTDLDGTLLNSKIEASDYTAKAINKLIAHGVKITFSTSRSIYTASMLLKDIDFELPCITFNGAYIIDMKTKQIVQKNLLTHELYDEVVACASKMGLRPYVFGIDNNKEERLLYGSPENVAQQQFLCERKLRNDKRLHQNTHKECLCEVINCSFLYSYDTVLELKDRLLLSLGESVSIKVIKDIYNDGYYTLEVSNKKANKGDMLKCLGQMLGVPLKDITVFGDQANDIEMFALAGTSVAVENASEELKNKATTIIKSNNEDGVAEYILQQYKGIV